MKKFTDEIVELSEIVATYPELACKPSGKKRIIKAIEYNGYFVEKQESEYKATIIHIPTGIENGAFRGAKSTAEKKARLYIRLIDDCFGEHMNFSIEETTERLALAGVARSLFSLVRLGAISKLSDINEYPEIANWKKNRL